MKNTPANEKIFWNSRARNYPLPFEPSTLGKTRRILRLLNRMGVEFTGRDILDIGCGTGVYALTLAGKACSVLGIDSSPAMLKIFRTQARMRGIGNARCRMAAWARVPGKELRNAFDISLASMTMAVKCKADLLRMEAAARERCVYIGWAGVRKNALLEAVYARHALKYKAPEGAGRILKELKAMGRSPRVKFITDSWEKSAPPGMVMRELAINMKVNGACLDRPWTAALLKRITRQGKVNQVTRVRKALITWRVPGRAPAKTAPRTAS
ncbi:MAG: hypothetical protein A2234_09015 [Elusimicrobia bacterium RIFOXYA2_FULL_58_8]|nr:MAG: hypothetical protein A2234_09015 [Elusimicrobia bacterium RIFOXYA2_FULL_58_8]